MLLSCGGPSPAPRSDAKAAAEPVLARIVQFYVYPGILIAGQQASLCYGTENVIELRLEPKIDEVWPAVSRCLPVAPKVTTRYTLYAKDSAGHEARQTVEVRVIPANSPEAQKAEGAPVPQIAKPVIRAFSAEPAEIVAGQTATLCFLVEGEGAEASLQPPVQELGQARQGCFVHAPRETTRYTLTAKSAAGKTQSTVTVTVK